MRRRRRHPSSRPPSGIPSTPRHPLHPAAVVAIVVVVVAVAVRDVAPCRNAILAAGRGGNDDVPHPSPYPSKSIIVARSRMHIARWRGGTAARRASSQDDGQRRGRGREVVDDGVLDSDAVAAVTMGMERRQWWPMVEWVKRERLREGRRLRLMGGGGGGSPIRTRTNRTVSVLSTMVCRNSIVEWRRRWGWSGADGGEGR